MKVTYDSDQIQGWVQEFLKRRIMQDLKERGIKVAHINWTFISEGPYEVTVEIPDAA